MLRGEVVEVGGHEEPLARKGRASTPVSGRCNPTKRGRRRHEMSEPRRPAQTPAKSHATAASGRRARRSHPARRRWEITGDAAAAAAHRAHCDHLRFALVGLAWSYFGRFDVSRRRTGQDRDGGLCQGDRAARPRQDRRDSCRGGPNRRRRGICSWSWTRRNQRRRAQRAGCPQRRTSRRSPRRAATPRSRPCELAGSSRPRACTT